MSPAETKREVEKQEDDIEGGGAVPLSKFASEPEKKGGLLKPIPETTLIERIAGGVAGLAIITALAAIVVEQSALVGVAGVLSMVVGPYAYYQQTRLTDIKALKETHKVRVHCDTPKHQPTLRKNWTPTSLCTLDYRFQFPLLEHLTIVFPTKAIKEEVVKLQDENNRLEENVTGLTTSVQHLEDVQQALDVITNSQGQSVSEFANQVEANKKILKQMKSNLKASILQNLLSVILLSDADGDLVISESETDDLVRRLNNISGLKLRESKFRSAISGKSIRSVMEIVKNLLKEDVPEDQVIFEIRSQ